MELKKHIHFALGYFLIIAFLGTLLRLFHVINIPINYKYIVHAHSHIALLGWIYTALTTIIYYCYLKEKLIEKRYTILFWCTQITLIGMLIYFPITGYSLYSILFSTLFLIISYWFFWFVIKHTSKKQKKSNSYRLIKTGLWFMLFSSIGPWALGIIMNTLGNTSVWYRNAIYFYLHFQYNGWFIVTLFGIFFYLLEKQGVSYSKTAFNQFYWVLILSVLLTYFISVLWTNPTVIFNFVAGFGSILQFIAFGLCLKLIQPTIKQLITSFTPLTLLLLKTASFLFIIKMTLQFLGSLTYFTNIISTYIDFAIGYLHWTFLGVVSFTLLGFLHHFKLLVLSKNIYWLYLSGFILTEVLIFYKGISHWLNLPLIESYYLLLAIASIIFLIPIALLFSFQFNKEV